MDHIVGLLNDAALLCRFGSYATSAFMSIAAIEEAGKSEMGLYIKQRAGKKVKKDLLCDHKKKETVAVMPTVAIGATPGRCPWEREDRGVVSPDLLWRLKTASGGRAVLGY